MGSQHVDGERLHGVISWPEETHGDVQRRGLRNNALAKAPAVHSIDVLTIKLRCSDNSTSFRALVSATRQ
jgi:hypothetical protein